MNRATIIGSLLFVASFSVLAPQSNPHRRPRLKSFLKMRPRPRPHRRRRPPRTCSRNKRPRSERPSSSTSRTAHGKSSGPIRLSFTPTANARILSSIVSRSDRRTFSFNPGKRSPTF